MRFGTCTNCSKYKMLAQDKTKCYDCVSIHIHASFIEDEHMNVIQSYIKRDKYKNINLMIQKDIMKRDYIIESKGEEILIQNTNTGAQNLIEPELVVPHIYHNL